MKKNYLLTTALCLTMASATAQKTYKITSPATPMKIVEGKLKMGGKSPQGGSISVNNYYMSIDGKPVIPIMGEFHYSRYPREQWEEQILKMKAGGITCIPTYVFWAFHEEYEGKFRWDGNLDLRYFLDLCKKHDMDVIIRIGPFDHGEVRQGALPEWLFSKPLEIRSDDPLYLKYVKRLYGQIGKQMKGLYYKDGGPVIGCQIENEMQHSASPWGINYPGEPFDYTAASWNAAEAAIGVEAGHKVATGAEAGNEHMRTLLKLAKEAGIDTPFYTATGWGNAAVIDNEAIPVTSAYPYPAWEAVPKMSPFLMFKDMHKHPDYEPVRYNPTDFPSFAAEMGAGMQIAYDNRPYCTAKVAEAMMVRCLGSGSNGIGYYMYQGGSTPHRTGQNAFMSDEAMGMPKVSYDYQAPLGEFGLEGESYRGLRLIHSFLAEWQDELAPMETVLPEGWEKMTPDNKTELRYCMREKDGHGFVFMINAQDHDSLRVDQDGLQLKLNLNGETLMIPRKGAFTLPKDESVILPFNLDMDGALLKYATAQPLTRIDDKGVCHYFFFVPEGLKPEYSFDAKTVKGKSVVCPKVVGFASTFTMALVNGKKIKVTTLTRQQALDACKVNGKLVVTKATVLPEDQGATLLSLDNNKIDYVVYPSSNGFKQQSVTVPPVDSKFVVKHHGPRRMTVHFNDSVNTPQVQEYFLRVNYVGDVGMAFMDSQLCNDDFWHGRVWTIGLKRYKELMHSQDMAFYFRPLDGNLPFVKRDVPHRFLPDFSKGPVLDIREVRVVPEYKATVRF